MSELKPCPFCGGEAQMGVNRESTVREYFIGCMNCHIKLYKIGYKRFYTETEVIAAWNTRAEYHGYEDAAVDAWKRIKAYQERTCKREKHGTKMDGSPKLRCSLCGYGIGDKRWSYCPNCGARVIKSDKDLAQEVGE